MERRRTREGGADVAVVLLTMNQKDMTLRCLESLDRVERPVTRVVLWDNGSTDGTPEAVRARFPAVFVHHSPENAGVATGRNEGSAIAIERFDPAYLFFMDNDMTVEPDALSALVEPLERDPRLGQTTGKIKDMGNPERLYGAGGCRLRFWRGDTGHVGYGEIDRGQRDDPRPCLASGGCMMVRRTLFERLGGFDATYDPYGPEDLDFGLRLREAGHSGLYVPGAVVYHETRPGRTFEGGQYTERYAAHRSRHWMTFMRRHASVPQKLAFYGVGAPWIMARLAWREARRGNLVPAVKGLLSGLGRAGRTPSG